MSNDHYIYIWKEKLEDGTERPFYVGQGKYHKNSKYKRAYEIHMGNGSRTKLARCQLKANKLARNGNPHIVEIVQDALSKTSADFIECGMILKYGRLDLGTGTLTNLSKGGDFNPSNDPEIEARRIQIIKSKEFRSKMSEIVKSRYEDPSYCAKIKDALVRRINHKSKQIEFNGVSYGSIRKLSIALGIPYETIRSRIKLNIKLDRTRHGK